MTWVLRHRRKPLSYQRLNWPWDEKVQELIIMLKPTIVLFWGKHNLWLWGCENWLGKKNNNIIQKSVAHLGKEIKQLNPKFAFTINGGSNIFWRSWKRYFFLTIYEEILNFSNVSFQAGNFVCAVVFWKTNTFSRLKRSVLGATLHLMVHYHACFKNVSNLWFHPVICSWISIARLPKMEGFSCEGWILYPFRWVLK